MFNANRPKLKILGHDPSLFSTILIKWGASLCCSMRKSDDMNIGQAHPTLHFVYCGRDQSGVVLVVIWLELRMRQYRDGAELSTYLGEI